MRLSAQTGKNKLLIFVPVANYQSACWASERLCKVSGFFGGKGGERRNE